MINAINDLITSGGAPLKKSVCCWIGWWFVNTQQESIGPSAHTHIKGLMSANVLAEQALIS